MINRCLCYILLGFLGLIFISDNCQSQTLKGLVCDQISHQPIAKAIVKLGGKTSLTNHDGCFSFSSFSVKDTLKIKVLGYQNFQKALTDFNTKDTIRIFLKKNAHQLNEVLVRAKKDYLKDSIKFRKDYISIFNYKYQPLQYFVIKRDFFSKVQKTKGQSSDYIVDVDLMSLLNLINAKKQPVSKLQKTLIKDEELDYVDRRFSKQLVQSQTGLKGDSLFIFMNKYKPKAEDLKKMSDYSLGSYIKNAYKEYLKVRFK